jgi:hypothetical protein
MSNLLTYKTKSGNKRNCNKRCYDSKSNHANCKCICHGHNHGRGLDQAKILTKKYKDRWIKAEQTKEDTVQTSLLDELK